MIYDLGDRKASIAGNSYYIADNATVIGSVRIGNNVSIWFNAVVRADSGAITIGDNSNVQDAAVLHCDEEYNLTIGRGVTVGHKAMLHGCTIGDNTLIGIDAIVLNGAVIGKNCLIGAGALVLESARIPDNSVVIGSPAKIARPVTQSQIDQIADAAEHYIKNFKAYKDTLRKQN